MSIYSLITDPMGVRYREKRNPVARKITSVKRSVGKAVFGPFRALNPMRKIRNLKKRVLRKVGYYSDFGRMVRTGDVGKYAKRKIFGTESDMGIIMPFRESQFTSYSGMYAPPPERTNNQTSPLKKGIFGKLAKYAAPGAVLGLGILASRKYNLGKKLGLITKPYEAAARKSMRQIKDMVNPAGAARRNAKIKINKWFHSPRVVLDPIRKEVEHHYNAFARTVKKSFRAGKHSKPVKVVPNKNSRGKTPSNNKGLKGSACEGLIMPFMESFGMPQQHQPQRKAGVKDALVGAAVIGGVMMGATKFGRLMNNPALLAKRAAQSYYAIPGIVRTANKSLATKPYHELRKGYHEMRNSAYNALTNMSRMIHGGGKAGRKIERKIHAAERGVAARHFLGTSKKMKEFIPNKTVFRRQHSRIMHKGYSTKAPTGETAVAYKLERLKGYHKEWQKQMRMAKPANKMEYKDWWQKTVVDPKKRNPATNTPGSGYAATAMPPNPARQSTVIPTPAPSPVKVVQTFAKSRERKTGKVSHRY